MGYYKHPTAVVESADIGEGTKIWHFVHVRAGARIGHNCTIGKSVYIDSDVEIGDGVKIQNFATLYKGVIIEDRVFIGPAVTFTNDKYPRAFHWDETQIVPTVVKRGASIGANATIICGIVVGAHAMIGAGALVTKDVPDHGLVLGNPAGLRGFVCRCGRQVHLKERSGKSVSLYCTHCGETLEVDSRLYESVTE